MITHWSVLILTFCPLVTMLCYVSLERFECYTNQKFCINPICNFTLHRPFVLEVHEIGCNLTKAVKHVKVSRQLSLKKHARKRCLFKAPRASRGKGVAQQIQTRHHWLWNRRLWFEQIDNDANPLAKFEKQSGRPGWIVSHCAGKLANLVQTWSNFVFLTKGSKVWPKFNFWSTNDPGHGTIGRVQDDPYVYQWSLYHNLQNVFIWQSMLRR
jgi:hypothetical protein